MELMQALMTLLATLIGALIALLGGWLAVGRQHRFNIEIIKTQTAIKAWSEFIRNLMEYRAAELKRLHRAGKGQKDSFSQEARQLRTRCRDSLMQLVLAEADRCTIQEGHQLIEKIRSIGHAAELSEGLLISEQVSDRIMTLIDKKFDHYPKLHPIALPQPNP